MAVFSRATFGRALDTNDKSFLVETEDSPLRVWAQFSPVSLACQRRAIQFTDRGNCNTLLQNLQNREEWKNNKIIGSDILLYFKKNVNSLLKESLLFWFLKNYQHNSASIINSHLAPVQIDLELPWGLSGKESACQCRRLGLYPWVGETPWRRKWKPTAVFLPGESHGQRSLAGYSPEGHKELSMTQSTLTSGFIFYSFNYLWEPGPKNIILKFLEINNSQVLNYTLF